MTESEYLACADPARLLEWLQGNHPLLPPCPAPPPSDRKLRLFACACRAISGRSLADVARIDGPEGEKILQPSGVAESWARRNVIDAPLLTQAAKAALLREVIGNPFRTPSGCWYRTVTRADGSYKTNVPTASPSWLAPAVLGIARRAYDLRDWEALPVLADALQEAGCEDEDVLMHCRGKGRCPDCLGKGGCCSLKDESGFWGDMHRCALCAGSGWVDAGPLHARGCWVLDLILGQD